MKKLQGILASTLNLKFQGPESISRLLCLNGLAHEAVLEAISQDTYKEDWVFAEEQVNLIDRFILNRYSLKCLDILSVENSKMVFEIVKQRLFEDIGFFLEQEQVSSIS